MLAAAVQMGAYGVDRHGERSGDALVAAFFLMKEDENGALVFRKLKQGGFDRGLGFEVREPLFGRAGVFPRFKVGWLIFQPCSLLLVVKDGLGAEVLALAAATLPLVLTDVDGDAVEIGGKHGIATELGQSAIEAQKDFLGQVLEMRTVAGEAGERAKDRDLVLAYETLKALR